MMGEDMEVRKKWGGVTSEGIEEDPHNVLNTTCIVTLLYYSKHTYSYSFYMSRKLRYLMDFDIAF